MREKLRILNGDILSIINNYPIEEKKKALEIIDEIEEDGRNHLELQPGIYTLLNYLKEKGIQVF